MPIARMDEGVRDMTLGDFLSICDTDIQMTVAAKDSSGQMKEYCTLQVWKLEQLVELIGHENAKDLLARIECIAKGKNDDIKICIAWEDEE